MLSRCSYHATIYPCTDNATERKEVVRGVITRMEELKRVLDQTQNHRHNVLITAAKHIRVWFIKIRKIKAIYHSLNLFNVNVTDKCMIGECWCPVGDLEAVHAALRQGMERSNGTIQPILNRLGDRVKRSTPPTYHRVNKFTAAFQNIVDAYGVASYREVNPAPFTVITFPFLFAVMFGDLGHGLIMFLFALIIVCREKQIMVTQLLPWLTSVVGDLTFRILHNVMSTVAQIFGRNDKLFFKPEQIFNCEV